MTNVSSIHVSLNARPDFLEWTLRIAAAVFTSFFVIYATFKNKTLQHVHTPEDAVATIMEKW